MTAAFSPLKRERDSNRELPEVFAYCNKHLEDRDFYNKQGIRKYGWWIEIKKRQHQELSELGQGGWTARLFKTLHKLDMPVGVFAIFCQGGVDFVGGYAMYHFIKKSFLDLDAGLTKIGNVGLTEQHGLKDGDQVHELVFQSGKVKFPLGWA